MTEPLLTCEAVFAETAFHLSNVPLVIEMISEGLIELRFDAAEHLSHLDELGKRYTDRHPPGQPVPDPNDRAFPKALRHHD